MFSVEPSDTIVLPANKFGGVGGFFQPGKGDIKYQLYPAVGNGMEVIYFDPDNPGNYNSYRFDSIRKLDGQKYICANSMELSKNQNLVNFLWEWEFYKIRPDGEILDTLPILDKRKNKNDYKMHWFMDMRRIPNKPNQYFIKAIKDDKRNKFNPSSKKQRINVMKDVGVGVIADITDTSVNIKREVGKYPETLFTDRKFKHVWPEFVVNEKGELAYYFAGIDSLYVTDIETNKTTSYSLNIFQTNNKNQYKSRFLNLFYDPYREYYYLTYLPPVNKKDEDGFLIDKSKRPWKLVVINENFQVAGKLSFPDEYTKHRMMIGDKGIYVKNDKLSEANSKGSVSVLFEFKEG